MQATGIRSLEKGLALLGVLRRAAAPLRLAEIARASAMSPSQAHGYLVSLVRAGFVAQDTATGQYELGDAALELGLAALGRRDFLTLARDTMASLAGDLGETVALSVWGERGPVVVDKLEGRQDSVYEIRIGSLVPIWPTATGRVYMAFLPAAKWRPVLDAAAGRGTVPPETELEAVLARMRADGLATTRPATVPEFSAVAVPVHAGGGLLRGVITVLGRAEGFDVSETGATARTIRAAGQALSRRLGHSGD